MHECFNKIVSLLESNAYEAEERREKKVLNLLPTEVSTHFLIKRKLLYSLYDVCKCIQQWVLIIEKLNSLESYNHTFSILVLIIFKLLFITQNTIFF